MIPWPMWILLSLYVLCHVGMIVCYVWMLNEQHVRIMNGYREETERAEANTVWLLKETERVKADTDRLNSMLDKKKLNRETN